MSVILILILFFVGYKKIIFTGSADRKYTFEQLKNNFLKNEDAFNSLAELFEANTTKKGKYTVVLSVVKNNKISLFLDPIVLDSRNKRLGAENMEIGSSKMDSILKALGWSKQLVNEFQLKLEHVNCNWIKTTQIYGRPIVIYPSHKGWGSYAYYIFNDPIDNSILQIHGRPLGEHGIAKRTFLVYSSAL